MATGRAYSSYNAVRLHHTTSPRLLCLSLLPAGGYSYSYIRSTFSSLRVRYTSCHSHYSPIKGMYEIRGCDEISPQLRVFSHVSKVLSVGVDRPMLLILLVRTTGRSTPNKLLIVRSSTIIQPREAMKTYMTLWGWVAPVGPSPAAEGVPIGKREGSLGSPTAQCVCLGQLSTQAGPMAAAWQVLKPPLL